MPDWQIKLLYDGQCPLCRREIDLLRRLDRRRYRLVFEDITSDDFDPSRYGRTMEDVRSEIHGVLPDGRIVTGMEAFRRAYSAVGLGWLLAPTRWPGVKCLADRGYRWFARNRYRLTGRHEACESDACSV